MIRSYFLAGAVLGTGTRGALLALGVAVLALWWNRAFIMRGAARKAVAYLSFTAICVSLISLDLGGVRSRGILERGTSFNSLHQRLETAGVAVDVAVDNLLFGVGYSGFRLVARDYGADTAFSQFWSPTFVAGTGNQMLQVLTDGGIVAFIAFIIFLGISLRTFKESISLSNRSLREFMLAGYVWLIALALGNQSTSWMLPSSLITYLLWLTLAMAVAIRWITVDARDSSRRQLGIPIVGSGSGLVHPA
jgi:hypothetical protein